TNLESITNDKRHRDEGKWGPPRQRDADAVDQAAAMMDRYNRIFLRTLRALCDMRRQSLPVIFQNGGPVNRLPPQMEFTTENPRRRCKARNGKTAGQRSSRCV